MTNFYKGGRGLSLPDEYVETLHATSLRPNEDAPQNNVCDIRRGAPMCAPNLRGQTHRSAPTVLLIIFFVSLLFNNAALAQSHDDRGAVAEVVTPLMVGQKVPDEFWTREHLFYINGDTVRKTLEEHKGKMLVLDFWMIGCVKCLTHQKEISRYKAAYKDELAVIMVNGVKTKNNYQWIHSYLTIERLNNLGIASFSSIIESSYLDRLFEPAGYPMYYWINQYGVLQTLSYRNLLDQNYVAPFLD